MLMIRHTIYMVKKPNPLFFTNLMLNCGLQYDKTMFPPECYVHEIKNEWWTFYISLLERWGIETVIWGLNDSSQDFIILHWILESQRNIKIMLRRKSLISQLQGGCPKSLTTHFSPHGHTMHGEGLFYHPKYKNIS